MLVAQISDLHIRRPGRRLHHMPDTARALARALRLIEALSPRPELILATGDLTDAGVAVEYARLRGLIEGCEVPIALLPGNHDDRDALRGAFPERDELGTGGAICYVIDGELRVIMLDSTKPGKGGGHLGRRRLAWLDETLSARPHDPTLIAMHHPPYATRTPYIDQLGFGGVDALASIVARHRHVVRVTSGHIHRASTTIWAGTTATTAPSTAAQLTLRPMGRRMSVPSVEPAGFLLHQWDGIRCTTTVVRVRDERREEIVAA